MAILVTHRARLGFLLVGPVWMLVEYVGRMARSGCWELLSGAQHPLLCSLIFASPAE